MATAKQLRKRQLAVIDDLFNGEFDEQIVLDRHKVSRNVYNKWLADEQFRAEFARRIAIARLQSEALIAKYSLVAAAKLVELTESQSPETARKACLDIICLPKAAAPASKQPAKVQKGGEKRAKQLSPETADKLLAVLAKEDV